MSEYTCPLSHKCTSSRAGNGSLRTAVVCHHTGSPREITMEVAKIICNLFPINNIKIDIHVSILKEMMTMKEINCSYLSSPSINARDSPRADARNKIP